MLKQKMRIVQITDAHVNWMKENVNKLNKFRKNKNRTIKYRLHKQIIKIGAQH